LISFDSDLFIFVSISTVAGFSPSHATICASISDHDGGVSPTTISNTLSQIGVIKVGLSIIALFATT
jgi:hypothetical protein